MSASAHIWANEGGRELIFDEPAVGCVRLLIAQGGEVVTSVTLANYRAERLADLLEGSRAVCELREARAAAIRGDEDVPK